VSTTSINAAASGNLVGSSSVAAAGQQVILMQQPQPALTHMPLNSTSSLNSSAVNKQYVVVSSAVSQQSGASVASTVGTSIENYDQHICWKLLPWLLCIVFTSECHFSAFVTNMRLETCALMNSIVFWLMLKLLEAE
jgi:hypothetical protein